jgi:hypothetical protein
LVSALRIAYTALTALSGSADFIFGDLFILRIVCVVLATSLALMNKIFEVFSV